jgi:hypothetical protein
VLADLVDRHDVRVVEVGRGFCFSVEALHVLCRGELARQDLLESHEPIQADLPRWFLLRQPGEGW